MKAILFSTTICFLFSLALFAQDAPAANGYLEARFDSSSGLIAYQAVGDVSKDGIKVIELKNSALDIYTNGNILPEVILDAIRNEKKSLEALRQRILTQREKMVKPLPPMQEIH